MTNISTSVDDPAAIAKLSLLVNLCTFLLPTIKVEEPPVRQKGIMVSDVAELVQKLKHEAKVI